MAISTITRSTTTINDGFGAYNNTVTALLIEHAVAGTHGVLTATTVNALTLTAAATGFTIAGGTSSKTLTLDANLTASYLADITSAEADQIEAIGTTTISATQWGYLGACGAGGGQLLAALTTGESDQLELIGATTISAAQWGYLGALDQSLVTTADPQFGTLKLGTATAKGLITADAAGRSFCVNYKADLADDASIALEDYITGPIGILWVIDTINASAAGSFFIQGAVNASTIINDPMTKLSVTDVDGKLCCIPDGDSTYTLKNRLGASRHFSLMFLGG